MRQTEWSHKNQVPTKALQTTLSPTTSSLMKTVSDATKMEHNLPILSTYGELTFSHDRSGSSSSPRVPSYSALQSTPWTVSKCPLGLTFT